MENLTDEKAVEDQKKRDQNARKQLKADIRKITKDAAGIRFFRWFFNEEAQIFGTSMRNDPNWTSFNEGRRDLALRILDKLVESTPERMPQILFNAEDR